MSDPTTKIIAYIPVIHQGYLNWLKKYPTAEVWVLGENITQEYRPLQKDLRALQSSEIVTSLLALRVVADVKVAEVKDLETMVGTVLMPDEVVSHAVAERYLTHCTVSFENVFLRWDSEAAIKPNVVKPDAQLPMAAAAAIFMTQAQAAAAKSADWWRQVGAVIVKAGQVLLTAHNQHLPSEQQPYVDGDPRADFHKGEQIDLTTAIHAEAKLISEAAKQGISLVGTQLYVTTFPCPNCAKLVANSGITEVVFKEGYAVLDGESILRAKNVTITQLMD
jgi:dCMP deaminase